MAKRSRYYQLDKKMSVYRLECGQRRRSSEQAEVPLRRFVNRDRGGGILETRQRADNTSWRKPTRLKVDVAVRFYNRGTF